MIIQIEGLTGEEWINRITKERVKVYSTDTLSDKVIIFGQTILIEPDSFLVLFENKPVDQFKIMDINELCDNFDRVQ